MALVLARAWVFGVVVTRQSLDWSLAQRHAYKSQRYDGRTVALSHVDNLEPWVLQFYTARKVERKLPICHDKLASEPHS